LGFISIIIITVAAIIASAGAVIVIIMKQKQLNLTFSLLSYVQPAKSYKLKHLTKLEVVANDPSGCTFFMVPLPSSSDTHFC
jgi:hypothetical protein